MSHFPFKMGPDSDSIYFLNDIIKITQIICNSVANSNRGRDIDTRLITKHDKLAIPYLFRANSEYPFYLKLCLFPGVITRWSAEDYRLLQGRVVENDILQQSDLHGHEKS